MLDLVYRNLSEEQSSMARLYRKQKPALLPARVFAFCIGGCRPLVGTPYFSAACTNGGVTSTPVCSAAV